MKIVTQQVQLESGKEVVIELAQASGFRYGPYCVLRLEDGRCVFLVAECSPVRLETMNRYWVALTPQPPTFADEGHKCAQIDLNHPDWLREEIVCISEGMPKEGLPIWPGALLPVKHQC